MIAVAIIGCVVGFMLGLTGAGGGVLAVPLIGLAMGLDIHSAITLSIIGVGSVSLVGMLRFAWRREIEWPYALPVAFAAMLGAPLGTILAALLPATMLTYCFIALSAWTVVIMFRGGCGADALASDCPVQESHAAQHGRVRIIVTGLATGVLAGAFGVGGGFLLVPALTVFAGLSMPAAARISLVAITLATLSAFVSRLVDHQDIPWLFGVIMALTGVWGLVHGQHLAQRLRPCRLKEIFASALTVILVLMLVDAVRHQGGLP